MFAHPLLLALALQSAPPAPELQIDARSTSGTEAPELAAAISRALLINGATVIMGPRAHKPCESCVRLKVREESAGRYFLEAEQGQHSARATIEVARDAPVFERACTVAIQARLLIGWEADEPPAPAQASRRDAARAAARMTLSSKRRQAEPTPSEPASAGAPAPEAALLPPLPAPQPTPAVLAVTDSMAPALPSAEPMAKSKGISALVPRRPAWPWLSVAVGAGAAIAAGGCAAAAGLRYADLSDRSLPLERARQSRDEGKRLQAASLALGGLAAAATVVGVIGFSSGSPKPRPLAIGAVPLDGGAMLAVSGRLP